MLKQCDKTYPHKPHSWQEKASYLRYFNTCPGKSKSPKKNANIVKGYN